MGWIPAFAGMTYGLDPRFRGDDLLGVPVPASCFLAVPAPCPLPPAPSQYPYLPSES